MNSLRAIAQAARSRSQALSSSNGTADVLSIHLLKMLLTEDGYRSSAVWTKEVSRFMSTICARTNMSTISEDDLRQQVFDLLSEPRLVAAQLQADGLEPYLPSWVKTAGHYKELADSLEKATSQLPGLLASICVNGRSKGDDAMVFFKQELDASKIRALLKP